MIGWRTAVLLLAVCLGVIVVSGAAAADPGTHQVNVTDGDGNVNASYQYDASAGAINVSNDGGSTWTQYSLSNQNESAVAIQWALDNSTSTYHTVRVGSGDYNGTVSVASDNRTLEGPDGAGVTNLTELSGQSTRGLYVTGSNLTVRDLGIRGFSNDGVVIDSTNVSVERMAITDVGGTGVRVNDSASVVSITDSKISRNSGAGIWITGSNSDENYSITNNSLTSNGGSGLRIEYTDGIEIVNNTITDSSQRGMWISDLENAVVEENTVRGNGAFIGISLDIRVDGSHVGNNTIEDIGGTGIGVGNLNVGGSSSNVLVGNQIINSSGRGIRIQANATRILDTNVSSNGAAGIDVEWGDDQLLRNVTAVDSGGEGILIDQSRNVTIADATIEDNGRQGIYLETNTDDVTIVGNVLLNNSYGLSSDTSDGYVLRDNNASNNRQSGIRLNGSSNVVFENTTAWNNAEDGIYLNGSSSDATIEGLDARSNTGSGAFLLGDSARIANGTFEQNGYSAITANGDGMVVFNNSITAPGQFGVILQGTTNSNVEDNVIRQVNHVNGNGIYLYQDANNNSIVGNRILNGRGTGIELNSGVLSGLSDNILSGNDVINNKFGILLEEAPSNDLVNNNVSQNGKSGVWVNESADTTISNVTARDNGNHGVWVANESDRTVVDGATTSGNAGNSVYVLNTSDATVNNSDVDTANLVVNVSPTVTLRNNTVNATVWVKGGSNNATIDANTIDGIGYGIQTHNVADGVVTNNHVNGSSHNIYLSTGTENFSIVNNEATNGSVGIIVGGVAGDNHTIRSNEVRFNQDGIRLDTNDTVVGGNTALNNTRYGIFVSGGSSNDVIDNNVTENGNNGIYVADSADNTIDSNDLTRNGQYSIEIVNGDRTLVVDNSIVRPSNAGMHVGMSQNVEIRNNSVTENDGFGEGIILGSNAVASLVVENTFNVSSGTALQVSGDHAIVRRNTFVDTYRGVSLIGPTNVTVADNTLVGEGMGGLGIMDSGSANAILSNSVTGFGSGIYLSGGSSTNVRGNNASGNAQYGVEIFEHSDARIEDTLLNDNGNYGIYVWGMSGVQSNNTFVNVTAMRNDDGVYYAEHVQTGTNTLTDVSVGDSTSAGTTIDAESDNVSISTVGAAPGSTPSGENELGRFLNVSNTSSTATLNLTVYYEDGDVSGLDESTTGLWNYTAASGWSERTSATLASGSNAINDSITLTGDQTIGLYAEDDGSGGGGPVFIPAPPSGDESGGSPAFTLTEIDLSTTEVSVGEAVTVSVRVDNDGDAHGTFTANLTADGEVVDSGSVQVNQNYHATLELATSFDEPGTYDLALDGESVGTVEVTGDASFSLGDVSLSSSSVAPGETVTITATITNDGTAEDSIEVPLLVGGQQADSRSVTLGPGESTTVTFEHTFEESGSQSVNVGGQEVGTVDVSVPDSSSSGDGGIGMVPIAIVGVVLVGASGGAYYYREEIQERVEEYRD